MVMTIPEMKAMYGAALIDRLVAEVEVVPDSRYLCVKEKKGGDVQYYSPITVVSVSRGESAQQPISNAAVKNVESYVDSKPSDGTSYELALTWVVTDGNDIYILSAPLTLVEAMKEAGGIFSHTDKGGYYFNISRYEEIKDHPEVLVAVHLRRIE